MAHSLGQLLLRTHGTRVLPLEVPRGYRDATGDERTVTFSQYVECPVCTQKGCEHCSFAGWLVDVASSAVAIPPGTTPGARLPVAAGVLVEIVEPGARAEELRAAERDVEDKLLKAWQMDRLRQRRRLRKVHVAIGGVLALTALYGVGHWLQKAATGETCAVDDDCRTGTCLRLVTVSPYRIAPRLEGQTCSSPCETDLDCPRQMHCATSGTSERPQQVENAPPGRACIPDGY